jgi:ribosome-associated toxin RatA of RatAB toxin-antitoxin module
MNNLQKSLVANAVFSGVSGLVLIICNTYLAHLFGAGNTAVFQIIGVALLFFACTIIYEIIKQRPLAVLWIIVQDFIWVLGSFILLIFNPFELSKAGNFIIAVVALVVLLMGLNQSKALAQIDTTKDKNVKHLVFERTVRATKSQVWKVIADVANYDKVAPNIDAVKIISGQGRGMVRSCAHGKDKWTESCTQWIEEKTYTFEVNTAAPDYPYKFIQSLNGTWEVQPLDNEHTKIVMHFNLQYKHKHQNVLLHPFLKNKFSKTAQELLDNWQKMLEK